MHVVQRQQRQHEHTQHSRANVVEPMPLAVTHTIDTEASRFAQMVQTRHHDGKCPHCCTAARPVALLAPRGALAAGSSAQGGRTAARTETPASRRSPWRDATTIAGVMHRFDATIRNACGRKCGHKVSAGC